MATHYLTRDFVVPIGLFVNMVAMVDQQDSFSMGTQALTNDAFIGLQDSVSLEDGFPFIVPLQDDVILKDDEQALGRNLDTLYISDPRYYKKNVGGQ